MSERMAALEAELLGYKAAHETYCPSAARVRELEAALREIRQTKPEG
jgi:hypothetical protein